MPLVSVTVEDPPIRTADDLAREYDVAEPERAAAFLKERPELASLLLDAAAQIKKCVGGRQLPRLEVVQDPEDERVNPTLLVRIPTRASIRTASAQLRRLDEAWWLQQAPNFGAVVCITIDFE